MSWEFMCVMVVVEYLVDLVLYFESKMFGEWVDVDLKNFIDDLEILIDMIVEFGIKLI